LDVFATEKRYQQEALMAAYANVVILTGAGVSAESGLATFRDAGGVWAKYDYRDVATPQGFARNPHLVHQFYNHRRAEVQKVSPNAAHLALAELERGVVARGGNVLLVTQNVDNLHEAAGSKSLIHMHGELLRYLCVRCGMSGAWMQDLSTEVACPACTRAGGMRPDVVWFGEMPYHMQRIVTALDAADLFISVGTSGSVNPAAGFVAQAFEAGAHTVQLNLEPSESGAMFAESLHGPATEIVPAFVQEFLRG
jgi:NAD-dependent deacetylase